MMPQALEWLERASQAPAPTTDESHQLLFELAEGLEKVGEVARALAVCMELQCEAGSYRDVDAADRAPHQSSGGELTADPPLSLRRLFHPGRPAARRDAVVAGILGAQLFRVALAAAARHPRRTISCAARSAASGVVNLFAGFADLAYFFTPRDSAEVSLHDDMR